MKNVFAAASILALGASGVLAGGIDRSGQDIGVLFENAGYVELSFGVVMPSVSGSVAGGAVPSGSVASSYTQLSLGIKQDINDRLSFAVIIDQPYGADVSYPVSAAPYPLFGTTATVTSTALTAVARYQIGDRFSVHGGLRTQSLSGDIAITGGYALNVDASGDIGYLAGAAYEIPDIALRVAVTYNSAIEQSLIGTETGTGSLSLDVTLPQSVNLDFQSGIAEDTLLFGSVRWVEWTAFEVAPPFYVANFGGDPLLSYDDDVFTYTLGVGRRFSDSFSGSISLAYEKSNGGFASNLSPKDGFFSGQVGGQYTKGNMKVSGGVRYVMVGDATTKPPVSGEFTGNSAIGVGMQIGFGF